MGQAAVAIGQKQIRAVIEEYLDLADRQRVLDRDSRAIAKKKADAKTKLMGHVHAVGGKELATVTCGYRLGITFKAGTVRWKDEFVAHVDEATAVALQEQAPPREDLDVTVAGGSNSGGRG